MAQSHKALLTPFASCGRVPRRAGLFRREDRQPTRPALRQSHGSVRALQRRCAERVRSSGGVIPCFRRTVRPCGTSRRSDVAGRRVGGSHRGCDRRTEAQQQACRERCGRRPASCAGSVPNTHKWLRATKSLGRARVAARCPPPTASRSSPVSPRRGGGARRRCARRGPSRSRARHPPARGEPRSGRSRGRTPGPGCGS